MTGQVKPQPTFGDRFYMVSTQRKVIDIARALGVLLACGILFQQLWLALFFGDQGLLLSETSVLTAFALCMATGIVSAFAGGSIAEAEFKVILITGILLLGLARSCASGCVLNGGFYMFGGILALGPTLLGVSLARKISPVADVLAGASASATYNQDS